MPDGPRVTTAGTVPSPSPARTPHAPHQRLPLSHFRPSRFLGAWAWGGAPCGAVIIGAPCPSTQHHPWEPRGNGGGAPSRASRPGVVDPTALFGPLIFGPLCSFVPPSAPARGPRRAGGVKGGRVAPPCINVQALRSCRRSFDSPFSAVCPQGRQEPSSPRAVSPHSWVVFGDRPSLRI